MSFEFEIWRAHSVPRFTVLIGKVLAGSVEWGDYLAVPSENGEVLFTHIVDLTSQPMWDGNEKTGEYYQAIRTWGPCINPSKIKKGIATSTNSKCKPLISYKSE